MPDIGIGLAPKQEQQQILSQEMRQGLGILQCPYLELRTELQKIMQTNPAIEDITWNKEQVMSEALPEEHVSGSVSEQELDFVRDDGMAVLNTDDASRDELLNKFDYAPESGMVDPDAESRRQVFFERQVKQETLQDHLTSQVYTSNISSADRELVIEMLIGNIGDDGWLHRSLADIQMVTGKSEKHLLRLLKIVSTFDPIGCGGRDLRETLLYQMEKLEDSPWEEEVRKLIDLHLDDLLKGRKDVIIQSLGIDAEELPKVLAELPKLSRKPGEAFSSRVDPRIYVVPEVFVERDLSGKWVARVPDRNMPKIKISKKYQQMMEDSSLTAEVRAYARSKVEAALALQDSIDDRQNTIYKVAQAIIDVQHEVFDKKTLSVLKPLKMQTIADRVGVHNSTVSRTVGEEVDKSRPDLDFKPRYMSTPLGLIEMRRFFVAGLKTENGESTVSNASVRESIRQLVEAEDKRKPLSDQKISDLLKEQGIIVARRTVAKYRDQLHISGASERKQV